MKQQGNRPSAAARKRQGGPRSFLTTAYREAYAKHRAMSALAIGVRRETLVWVYGEEAVSQAEMELGRPPRPVAAIIL